MDPEYAVDRLEFGVPRTLPTLVRSIPRSEENLQQTFRDLLVSFMPRAMI